MFAKKCLNLQRFSVYLGIRTYIRSILLIIGYFLILPSPILVVGLRVKSKTGSFARGENDGWPLFLGKRLSSALFLDRLKSGSFIIQSRNKATIDAHGWFVYILHIVLLLIFKLRRKNAWVYTIRIGVGFCALLVLDWMGKCQSLTTWNE